jgi:hypothetical protein
VELSGEQAVRGLTDSPEATRSVRDDLPPPPPPPLWGMLRERALGPPCPRSPQTDRQMDGLAGWLAGWLAG